MWREAPEHVRESYITTEATLRAKYKVNIAEWRETQKQKYMTRSNDPQRSNDSTGHTASVSGMGLGIPGTTTSESSGPTLGTFSLPGMAFNGRTGSPDIPMHQIHHPIGHLTGVATGETGERGRIGAHTAATGVANPHNETTVLGHPSSNTNDQKPPAIATTSLMASILRNDDFLPLMQQQEALLLFDRQMPSQMPMRPFHNNASVLPVSLAQEQQSLDQPNMQSRLSLPPTGVGCFVSSPSRGANANENANASGNANQPKGTTGEGSVASQMSALASAPPTMDVRVSLREEQLAVKAMTDARNKMIRNNALQGPGVGKMQQQQQQQSQLSHLHLHHRGLNERIQRLQGVRKTLMQQQRQLFGQHQRGQVQSQQPGEFSSLSESNGIGTSTPGTGVPIEVTIPEPRRSPPNQQLQLQPSLSEIPSLPQQEPNQQQFLPNQQLQVQQQQRLQTRTDLGQQDPTANLNMMMTRIMMRQQQEQQRSLLQQQQHLDQQALLPSNRINTTFSKTQSDSGQARQQRGQEKQDDSPLQQLGTFLDDDLSTTGNRDHGSIDDHDDAMKSVMAYLRQEQKEKDAPSSGDDHKQITDDLFDDVD